jgi:hypothetical protein
MLTASGKTHHPMVKFSGRKDSRVSDAVLEIRAKKR